MTNMRIAVAAGLCIAALAWQSALAGGPGCAHCGCAGGCRKVCRLEAYEKKVEVTCYGCKCEEFCLPGPSRRGCKHCETVCESCADDQAKTPYSPGKAFVWSDWLPNPCATIHTKKKLMKKTITVKVPSYRWVVEDVCAACDAKTPGAHVPPGTSVPAPPVAGGRLKYFAEAEVPIDDANKTR